MPRDDLSIDFVRRMPVEALDPAVILDDWINRVQNLPEEIRFMHDEILEKDRLYNDCVRAIEERDSKIQRWIKSRGAHEPNPKEDALRAQIRDRFVAADKLSAEKIALAQRMQFIMDKHLRSLDAQIKLLFDRNEPGFTNPDELPSLLRGSAANHSAPSARSINPSAHPVAPPMTASPLNPTASSAHPNSARLVPNLQARAAQAHPPRATTVAPPTPASTILARQAREDSAGPNPKRPRTYTSISSLPATANGLTRHSSLGPGTPKTAPGSGPSGHARAGSAGPRAGPIKAGVPTPGSRKQTPSVTGRKRLAGIKSSVFRLKKNNKNSPASTADSDLSDADTGSVDEDEAAEHGAGSKPSGAGDGREHVMEVDDDEAADDKKYCICQNVSYGDMVACDNGECPLEWFHWSCVGLRSEPTGDWLCPVCTEKVQRKTK